MAKDDFDIDFDFEKEYGFDPKAVLDSDTEDDALDLSEIEKEFGLDLSQEPGGEENADDFDFSALGLDEEPEAVQTPVNEAEPELDLDLDLEDEEDLDLDLDFDDAFLDGFEDEDLDAVEDLSADFARRADFFMERPEGEAVQEEPAAGEPEQEIPGYGEEEDMDPEDDEVEDDEEEEKPRRRRPAKPRTPREPIKLTVPPVLMKLYALYFPPKESFEPQVDPANPRRRRRKSKVQVFKEAYLPAMLACLSLVLVLYFIAGAIGNAFAVKKIEDERAQKESIAASNSLVQAELEAQRILDEAKRMAAGYDYDGAITMLDSYTGKATDEITQLKSSYMTAKSSLVEHKDATLIPNLSFHVLIADPARAFVDKEYGGQYNRNFVTIDEFSKILEQLYKNNYVLVDYDSFVASNTGLDGNDSFLSASIWLPEGKKPFMLTETMVNYYGYMTDSNEDGEPDGGADGFASKLVLSNGELKNEYIDASGQKQIGDYDLVPILETFIKQHPDFVYKGARATLAVSGKEGVFGYRINTSVVSTKGNDYYDTQVAGAKEIVAALRERGYTIACYTFEDKDYKQMNTTQIKADIESWKTQITPVIGEVDTLVFAKSSNISDYGGTTFEMLYDYGFRIFVSNADSPYTEINNTYVRQSRLMVTGNALAWKSTQFASLFDSNLVLNLTARGGSVPN